MKVKPLITCVGGSAEGEKRFFHRVKLVKKLRRKLANKEHLLISAPRRIGKTSLLKYIRNKPEANQVPLYLIVQSVSSIDEFNKRLLKEIVGNELLWPKLQGWYKKNKSRVTTLISKVRKISLDGVEIDKEDNIDYYEALTQALSELRDHDKQIIIIIDEFPDAVTNIKNRDSAEALTLLQQQRELREIHSKTAIQFVYTGSTGLRNVVRLFKESHLLNNLVEFTVLPFSSDDVKDLMRCLVLGKKEDNASFDIPESIIDYAVQSLDWKLPYFAQILIESLFDEFEDAEGDIQITESTVDDVLDRLIQAKSEHRDYFEHWKQRVDKLPQPYNLIAKEVLMKAVTDNTIRRSNYHDICVKHKAIDSSWVLDMLQYDGYLTEISDGSFGFNSSLLQKWWSKNVSA